jgi:hypothetical protein
MTQPLPVFGCPLVYFQTRYFDASHNSADR